MEPIVLFLLAWSVYSINKYFYKKEEFKKGILANSLISLTIVIANTLGNFEISKMPATWVSSAWLLPS